MFSGLKMFADNPFSKPKILHDEIIQHEYLAGKYLSGKIWINGPCSIELKSKPNARNCTKKHIEDNCYRYIPVYIYMEMKKPQDP